MGSVKGAGDGVCVPGGMGTGEMVSGTGDAGWGMGDGVWG